MNYAQCIGGRTGNFGTPFLPQFGGAIGLDHGTPFGSFNVNGRVLGKFGPQGY